MNRIFYTKPSITELEVEYATDAARNGWGDRCYDYVTRLEAGFAAHLGVRFAISTSSCTGALHMGLAALGIGRGDEVIVGDINWIASAAPITYLGARPIFVDVLPDSWCLDPAQVEAAITPRTKAIVAVHLYGNLCELDQLRELAATHGLALIEDAAEAIGSRWQGRAAGSVGTFGTFSFHGTKTLTTGEGGMFVTNDEVMHEKVLSLSNHGRVRGQVKQFWPDLLGFKYKMSNVQAAIGCAQLERVEALVERKRQIFDAYALELSGLPIRMNPESNGNRNGYWMPTIVIDRSVDFDRGRLLRRFADQQIDGRVFFAPLSQLPMFQAKPNHIVAYDMHQRALNLPSYHDITEDDIARVVRVIRSEMS